MPTSARTRKGPADELMNCGITNAADPTCWDCRFYEPHLEVDRDQPSPHEGLEGDCQRYPPVTDHGRRDSRVNYADFPIVMESSWCGEFVPRAATLPQYRDEEANAAFDAARHEDATVGPCRANGRECQCGRGTSSNGKV